MVAVWRHLKRRTRSSCRRTSASNSLAATAATSTGCSNYPVDAGASGPADESLEQHEDENVATDAVVGGVGVASAFAEVNVKYRRAVIEKLLAKLGTREVRVGEPSAASHDSSTSTSSSLSSSSARTALVLLPPIGEFTCI